MKTLAYIHIAPLASHLLHITSQIPPFTSNLPPQRYDHPTRHRRCPGLPQPQHIQKAPCMCICKQKNAYLHILAHHSHDKAKTNYAGFLSQTKCAPCDFVYRVRLPLIIMPITHLPIITSHKLPLPFQLPPLSTHISPLASHLSSHPSPLILSALTLTISPSQLRSFPLQTNANPPLQLIDPANTK